MTLIKYLSIVLIFIVIIFLVTSIKSTTLPNQLSAGDSGDLTAAVATSTASKQFDYDLTTGSTRSSDIFYLQEFLRGFGFFTYPTSTGTYGSVTADAVKKFQIANNIPATGIFNTLTRTLANRIIVAKKIKFTAPSAPKMLTTNPIASNPATPKPVTQITATSTAKGIIKISNIVRASTKANEQYITIRNSTGKDSIDITGFKIVNSTGNQYIIPKGHTIPGVNPVAQDNIILKPGNSVKIIVGSQISQMNFQENLCTGYLDEKTDFGKNLSRSCPKPDYSTKISVLSDYCISVFDKTPVCTTIDNQKTQQPACQQFSVDHFNYQGCLKDFSNKTGFLKGNWLVWMQRPSVFFRSLRDIVILYDREGRIVDQYSY